MANETTQIHKRISSISLRFKISYQKGGGGLFSLKKRVTSTGKVWRMALITTVHEKLLGVSFRNKKQCKNRLVETGIQNLKLIHDTKDLQIRESLLSLDLQMLLRKVDGIFLKLHKKQQILAGSFPADTRRQNNIVTTLF